jgi:hypothetical protein
MQKVTASITSTELMLCLGANRKKKITLSKEFFIYQPLLNSPKQKPNKSDSFNGGHGDF